jgi:hypothetical protein
MSWEKFRTTTPPFSIAIDGFVCEGPRLDANGPYANFNHHEGVSRLETRSTAAQVLMEVRMGLGRCFRKDGELEMSVYANDCDEDVSLAYFVLSHITQCESPSNRILNRLVQVSDFMDTTSGLYPLSTDEMILREMAWVFEPYRAFRISGELEKRNGDAFAMVVETVCARVNDHLSGRGKSINLDARYKKIGGGPSWSMIEEIGPFGRQGAFYNGVRAFVSARQRTDGTFAYTIGRASEFIPFPVQDLLEVFNLEESTRRHEHTLVEADTWGGATTIGGSPRTSGSNISPSELEKIINDFLAR